MGKGVGRGIALGLVEGVSAFMQGRKEQEKKARAQELIDRLIAGGLGTGTKIDWQIGSDEMPRITLTTPTLSQQEATTASQERRERMAEQDILRKKIGSGLNKLSDIATMRERITPKGAGVWKQRIGVPTGEGLLRRSELEAGKQLTTPSWMKQRESNQEATPIYDPETGEILYSVPRGAKRGPTVSKTDVFTEDAGLAMDAIERGADPNKVFDRLLRNYPDKVGTIEELRFKYATKF